MFDEELAERERSRVLWAELVASGGIPTGWAESPRRSFALRVVCLTCGGTGGVSSIRAGLLDPCSCDAGGWELVAPHPPTARAVRRVAASIEAMELAEALAAQAACALQPAGSPRSVRWWVDGFLRCSSPAPLHVLDRALACGLGTEALFMSQIDGRGAWMTSLAALQRAFEEAALRGLPVAAGRESPIAALLVLGDLGFRLVGVEPEQITLMGFGERFVAGNPRAG